MSTHLHSDPNHPNTPKNPVPARVIAVASGKGGVGKTNLVTNLAIAVAARGYRVCIVDADPGMANINIVLGFSANHGLPDVLNGDVSLEDALFKGPQGIEVLAGASGLVGIASFQEERRGLLLDVFGHLEDKFDVIFVDLAAGADSTVTDMMRIAHHRLVVVTPDPTSLTNAYSLLKIVETESPELPVELVVNQATDDKNGLATFHRLKKVCDLFLKNNMEYLGYICNDPTIVTSVRLRRPVVLLKHDSPASRCFYQLAQSLLQSFKRTEVTESSLKRFWQHQADEVAAAPPLPTSVEQESAPETEEETAPEDAMPQSEEALEQTLQTLCDTLLDKEAGAPGTQTPEPGTATATPAAEAAAPASPPPMPPMPSSEELAAVDAMTAPLPDRAALLEQLSNEMSAAEMNEHEAGMIVLSMLSSCLNGYGRYPIDIRALVNAAINRRELSAEALRHLASQLQQTYRDRFGHELYPVDSNPDLKASNR